MSTAILIDYGCHSFTYRLATRLSDAGLPIRYFANGSLESPNLASLSGWMNDRPHLVRSISCGRPYGKMSLHHRLKGEIEWAGRCIRALGHEQPAALIFSCIPLAAVIPIQTWAQRRNIPVIYWLQDIQGRAMHDLLGRKLGLLGRVVGAFAYLWEQQILDNSRMVITIAHGHERELPHTVRRDDRYALLENWANIEEFPALPPDNDWAIRQGLDKTLNILYSGTLGLKHDLNTFLALASRLRNRRDVRVVVVSSGQAADKLRSRAAANGLNNLLVLPFQSDKDVPKVLASAAVLIAPLDAAAGSFCVPSKILSYLCSGRPTVMAIDGQNPAAQMIVQTGAGSVVAPGDSDAFVSAVTTLLDNPAERLAAGGRARSYAESAFAIESVTSRFLSILNSAGLNWRYPLPLSASI